MFLKIIAVFLIASGILTEITIRHSLPARRALLGRSIGYDIGAAIRFMVIVAVLYYYGFFGG